MKTVKATIAATAAASAVAAVAAVALSITSLSSFAHDGQHKKMKDAPVKMEQKEWGIAGDPKQVKRTITLTMSDAMRFTPNQINVKEGETVRIALKNNGKVLHEMVIGTKKELEEHAALMLKFPNMEHAEPYMAHIAPGKTGEIIWNFNKGGEFDFACLVAGHYQAGMTGKITVAGKSVGSATAAAIIAPKVAEMMANAPATPNNAGIKPAEVSVKADAPMAVGEIQKIDKAAGKVTIKHGEIKNIDMPPMTMVFRVKDAAMLDGAKVGDKINFEADKINGNFTVTKIEAAK